MNSRHRQLFLSFLATLATAGGCAVVTLVFLGHGDPAVDSAVIPTVNTNAVRPTPLGAGQRSQTGSNTPPQLASAQLPASLPSDNVESKPPPSEQQSQAAPALSSRPTSPVSFSEEERIVFSSLPPMCTADLSEMLAQSDRQSSGTTSLTSQRSGSAPTNRPQAVVPQALIQPTELPTTRPATSETLSPANDLLADPVHVASPNLQHRSGESGSNVAGSSVPALSAPEMQPSAHQPAVARVAARLAEFANHPSMATPQSLANKATGLGPAGFHGSAHSSPPHSMGSHSMATHSMGSVRRADLASDESNDAIKQVSFHGSIEPTDQSASDVDPHQEVYSRDPFPSAKQCAQCHKQIYEEWAASSHAYASISPMFHVFEETINRLSQGTIGYFCYRCHSPVSTTVGLRRDQPIWDGPRVFREGVTCIACHRVKTPYGKVDGERRIEPGDIYEPVYGAGDGQGVAIADKYREFFKVKTDRRGPKRPGQPMHRRSIQFEELSKSTYCMSCHQVAVEPGIKLEVVWDQYRASPAYRQGITCQDCHMGRVPGVDEGYSIGPGAIVNNKVINAEKKHSNHVFYGPGYSIAHPGVFPDNLDADRWTVPQWLEFDWRAGWGTDKFEDALADGQIQWNFPKVWEEVDDRYDAREIIDANLKKLEYKRDLRRQLLENGSKLDGPFFNAPIGVNQPLKFRYCVTNLNSGHNMPSGSLGAQPQLWLNVVLIDPYGNRIWESGYLDSNGDLADNHSLDVLARKIPLDTQLVNFQTKFLTTNVKGTDREMYLPVNFDFDQLPFLRPPQQPVSVINHPPFVRMEAHSIPPLGKRNAKFSIPSRLIRTPGTYRLSIRMRSRAEPIYFMRFCNATPEMERMMNEWICDFHQSTTTFEVR